MFSQLHHHVRSGGDRVGAEEQSAAGFLGGGKETPCGGDITGDVAVTAFRHAVGLGDLENVGVHHFQLVGIFVAFCQNGFVQFDDIGLLGELALQICVGLVEFLMGGIEDDA